LLIILIRKDIDKKIDIEMNNIDSYIKREEIEKTRREEEIEILNKRLKIIDQRKSDIITEMKSVKRKIDTLEKEQLNALRKENRTEAESLGMLLYSVEIQQSLMYYDDLNEKLSRERLQEETFNSEITNELAEINKSDNLIANLKERKGRIDYTKIVKAPTPSKYPTSPKKKLNVLIAGVLGLILLTGLVFFFDYIEKKK
jgi:LPS O-antigen subunit length determinant protein (WzzB/FepE family)